MLFGGSVARSPAHAWDALMKNYSWVEQLAPEVIGFSRRIGALRQRLEAEAIPVRLEPDLENMPEIARAWLEHRPVSSGDEPLKTGQPSAKLAGFSDKDRDQVRRELANRRRQVGD